MNSEQIKNFEQDNRLLPEFVAKLLKERDLIAGIRNPESGILQKFFCVRTTTMP